ncbi:LysR family transcriptional regulator [Sphingomonas crocodyli]|uniref:LysR family transcriptional regulator n=1 Tax=Sphingomonas crocodyli TaxID=1979270 RepID=A0A437M0C4_9SPHN|nr:LysR family transcriptional regulator [Sphingomonas crocodyli]RVT91141.1 LysR family transcriptional regulator [Sphingomonas crocodyli]
MSRITPADLDIFLAIARAGSFRGAAMRLGVTPSALSHRLRALEERIDLRLFNRTTRSVALTEAGQALIDRVRPAFDDIEAAIDDLAAFRGTPMGTLRINAAETSARIVLAPLLPGFLAKHPGVAVEIIAQGALVDVVAGGFDAGVRLGETLAADMIAVPIGPRQRFAVVGSPAFFERHARPQTPNDLLALPCVRFHFDNGGAYHWELERGGVELQLAVNGPFATNSQDMMIAAALDGIGLAFVFEAMVEPLIASGRLERVLDDWCPWFPGLFLYYPGRRHMPTALRAFIDHVRDPG